MRAHVDFAIASRLMAPPWLKPGPALLPLPYPVPSIDGLVEAVQTLNTGDAFRPRFNAEKWRAVASYLVRQELRSGDALVRRHERGSAAYLIESGTLLVHPTPSPRSAASVALLRAGALVGEAALFGASEATSQVDAISPCVVWALDRARLADLLAGHPGLAYEFLKAAGAVLRRRLRAGAADLERAKPTAHMTFD
jgi:CRP/FNR family transcriptional regulator, cyclic AMP receptor protein